MLSCIWPSQMIVSLFNAIRATRLEYLQKKHPTLRENEVRKPLLWFIVKVFDCSICSVSSVTCVSLQLVPKITRQCLKEGYMEKTGPTVRQTTWIIMKRNLIYLLYFYKTNQFHKLFLSLSRFLFLCVLGVCVFSATGTIQETVVHAVLNKPKAYIL